MTKQAELFDEMDRLRDEVRKSDEMGGKIASLLKTERDKNAALEEKIEYLRDRPGGNDVFDWPTMSSNRILFCATFATFLAWCWADALSRTPPSEFNFDVVFATAARLAGQALFLLWCYAIYKRKGVRTLCKRCASWAVGWMIACLVISKANNDMPMLGLKMIPALFPANWWSSPFPLNVPEHLVGYVLLWVFADLNTEFTLSRGAFAATSGFVQKMREAKS